MNGRRSLTPVYDLEILQSPEQQPSSLVVDLDLLRSGRDAVVVRKEHRRFIFQGHSDSLVYFPASLQEDAHVLLQKARAPPIINVGQDLPGNNRQIGFVIGFRVLCGKNRERPTKSSRQIDVDILTAVSDRCLPVKTPNIPDAVGDLPPVQLVRLAPIYPFAKLPICNQDQSNPICSLPSPIDHVRKPEPRTCLLERVSPLPVKCISEKIGQSPKDGVHIASDEAFHFFGGLEVLDQEAQCVRIVEHRITSVTVYPNAPPGGTPIRRSIGGIDLARFHQMFAEPLEEDILQEFAVRIGLGNDILKEVACELLNSHWKPPRSFFGVAPGRRGTLRSREARPCIAR